MQRGARVGVLLRIVLSILLALSGVLHQVRVHVLLDSRVLNVKEAVRFTERFSDGDVHVAIAARLRLEREVRCAGGRVGPRLKQRISGFGQWTGQRRACGAKVRPVGREIAARGQSMAGQSGLVSVHVACHLVGSFKTCGSTVPYLPMGPGSRHGLGASLGHDRCGSPLWLPAGAMSVLPRWHTPRCGRCPNSRYLYGQRRGLWPTS